MNQFASAYDQNPARLALILRSSRKSRNSKKGMAAFRLLFGLAAIATYIWFVVPV